MLQSHNGGFIRRDAKSLLALLTRLTQLAEEQELELREQNELARARTETTSNLAGYSSRTAENADRQTGLAQERTALTREQTHLSTRSAELANIRTELAQERTLQAEERSRLATQRTEMAGRRTSYSEWRTRLAERRNDLARDRTTVATTRTRLSIQRTELARGRTSLALIRTGLSFMTLGITFFRYFGLSAWTFFDGGLVVFSALMVFFGTRGYRRSQAVEKRMAKLLVQDVGMVTCYKAY